MAFTDKQAALRAKQIHHDVGGLIHDACAGTGIKESFLAGFTGVEAAFSKDGPKLDSKRFEIGVYQDLISLRDNGYCYVGGKKRSTYNKVTRVMIADASDAAVKNLATSWGCTQIMGYWGLVLGCTVAELRDPAKHFHYTVQLLKIVSGHYLMQGDLASVLHIWNTGSANGKTYHEDYVVNALKVKTAYDKLVSAAETSKSEGPVNIPTGPAPGDQTNTADGGTPPTIKQEAENIINTGDQSNTPPPEDKTLTAPAKDGATATSTKMVIAGVAIPPVLAGILKAISDAVSQGYVQASDIGTFLLGFLRDNVKWVLLLLALLIVLVIVKKIIKAVTFWIEMLTHAIPGWNNIIVQPAPPVEKKGWLKRAVEWVW